MTPAPPARLGRAAQCSHDAALRDILRSLKRASSSSTRPALRDHERGASPVIVAAIVAAILAALIAGIWLGVRARQRRAADQPVPAAEVRLLAPLGNVGALPPAFTWTPVPSAASYKVTIGDDDALWPIFVRTTTTASLPLDPKDAAAIAAGRVHAWEVVALDAAGNPVARGRARFRVRLPGESEGDEPPN